MKKIKIFFDEPKTFEMPNIKPLGGIMGLYFIFNSETEIQYPFEKSRLIYIGMSEKRTNSIGKRLSDHYDGKSGNPGLVNYRKVEPLYFTYINFEMLKKFWEHRIEDLESYFILDFVIYLLIDLNKSQIGSIIINVEIKRNNNGTKNTYN